jgi:hypothetical protein
LSGILYASDALLNMTGSAQIPDALVVNRLQMSGSAGDDAVRKPMAVPTPVNTPTQVVSTFNASPTSIGFNVPAWAVAPQSDFIFAFPSATDQNGPITALAAPDVCNFVLDSLETDFRNLTHALSMARAGTLVREQTENDDDLGFIPERSLPGQIPDSVLDDLVASSLSWHSEEQDRTVVIPTQRKASASVLKATRSSVNPVPAGPIPQKRARPVLFSITNQG